MQTVDVRPGVTEGQQTLPIGKPGFGPTGLAYDSLLSLLA